ncbi:hypothetical protein MVEN_01731700 [Mycena venus]|uniref:Uncharacterized protein n=1 Tax=Mycena venus TaxID=2733690 RepID=A0A8H7CMC1_9AGAR|nr:hypothetical protein MVEN_01731700 [Mycena venus]
MSQKRGVKPKDLGPDCVEVGEGTGKVYCRICHIASGTDIPSIINRTSWAKHLQSPTHSLGVQQVAEAKKKQADTRRQYDELYTMHSAPLQVPVLQPEFNSRQARFRPILLDEDMNGISSADFQDVMMQELDTLRAEPEPDDFLVQNAEALRREIEILQLQHLEAEFEGADDETIPRIAQEIRDNDILRMNGEDEDEINQHFAGVPVTHDYAPYGNKTVHRHFLCIKESG